jgi:hypothetical protein
MNMATGIRIDDGSVVIPLELLDTPNQGLAVLTLARGAFLVMSTDVLAALPRERLLDFSRAAQAVEGLRSDAGGAFSSRKQQALDLLHRQGYTVSGGLEYGLRDMATHGVTLEQVWRGLATMEGSLAEEVAAEREER